MNQYNQLKSRDNETITLREALQVLIPIAAVAFLFVSIRRPDVCGPSR